MRNTKILAFVFTGLFVLSMTAYLQPSSGQNKNTHPPETKASPVTIVNTPLPVAIGNPAVLAQQSGAWTVGISGVPTVKVDPGSPVPVLVQMNEPAWQPFFCQLQLTIPEGYGSTYGTFVAVPGGATFAVPAGKRGVVEFASLYAVMPAGHRLAFPRLSGGNANNQFFQAQAIDVGQEALVSASQPMTMYLNSGNGLTLWVGRSSPEGSQLIDAFVTGHFVDLP